MLIKIENADGLTTVRITDPGDGLTTVHEIPDGSSVELTALTATSPHDIEVGDVERIDLEKIAERAEREPVHDGDPSPSPEPGSGDAGE